jgi:L-rhamnose mutarotase
VKRVGQVIKIRTEKIDEYKELHANAWPEILKKIWECNIRNYSIFLKDNFLFAYFEYIGEDFEADMDKMADDPKTQEWWSVCKPCQEPIETRKEGEWWADMDEVFYHNNI